MILNLREQVIIKLHGLNNEESCVIIETDHTKQAKRMNGQNEILINIWLYLCLTTRTFIQKTDERRGYT